MNTLPKDKAFLAIPEDELCSYAKARFVIQQVPYEHTSSYIKGSANGPGAIIDASHFVEFYDEELEIETYKQCGIATLEAINFKGAVDEAAVSLIEKETDKLLDAGKFVVSIGAEHTVTNGFVRSHKKKYPGLAVLQIDAHSDLRESYNDNIYSHASVMKRIHDMGVQLVQIGIRAQCKEEAELIRSSKIIDTFYAHQIRKNSSWMQMALDKLPEHVYLTIDADGFDPAVIPAVGTAEPNGLFWFETLEFLRLVSSKRKIIGFDIVECAPVGGSILSEYTLAKLLYRLIGYIVIGY